MGVHSLFGFYSFQEQHLKRALVTDTSYVVTHWHRNCSCFLGPLHFLGQLRTAQAYAMVSLSSLFFATVSVTCVNFRLKYCGGGMAFAQCRSSKLMRQLQAGRSSGNYDKINIVLLFFKLNTLQDGWEGLRTRLKYYTTIYDNIQNCFPPLRADLHGLYAILLATPMSSQPTQSKILYTFTMLRPNTTLQLTRTDQI